MNEEKIIPEIRFKEFSNNWEQCQFKDFTKLSQGLQIAISERFLEPGENKVTYITNEFLNPSSKKRYYIEHPSKNVIANVDDILMTRTGNTGKVVTNTAGAFHNNFFKIDYNKEKYSKLYLYYLLTSSKIQKEILVRAGTSTIPDLNHNDFYKIKVNIPSIVEQTKIGNLLRRLDDIIILQEQLLNDHKQLKKAMLQKMFPQKGESVPRIRFAGFTGNWKKHKLGNYLTIPEKNEKKVTNLDELITLKLNLLGMYSGSNRATLELGSTKYYERKAGQFLYGKQNFFNGSMGIIPAELDGKATSGDVPAFDINDINRDYIFTYVSRPSYWKSKESQSSGTGSKRIHEKVLQTFDINVPSSEEQTKIGNFFKQLDETIVLNEKKLETYQNLKKAMLQKMFV